MISRVTKCWGIDKTWLIKAFKSGIINMLGKVFFLVIKHIFLRSKTGHLKNYPYFCDILGDHYIYHYAALKCCLIS